MNILELLKMRFLDFVMSDNSIGLVFLILISSCIVIAIFISLSNSYEFYNWKNKFDNFIAGVDSLEEEDKNTFTNELEGTRYKDIINSIKSLLKDSKEMSVSDINLLIQERLLRYEKTISSLVTIILSIGLFFTLFGVFLALDSAFSDADKMKIAGNAKEINLNILMDNFSISFVSTFISFITTMIINLVFLQLLTKYRENFKEV